MAPPRLLHLERTAYRASCTLNATLPSRRPQLPFLYPYLKEQTRQASHASQGQANRSSRSAGKRLGLKRAATELVVPGNIIFRQRGTHWFPGENCGMGRDHSIFAKEKGYVVFYKAPWNGVGYGGSGRVKGEVPGKDYKKYIGVVFKRGDTLPRPPGAQRQRRLGFQTRTRRDFTTGTADPSAPLSQRPTVPGVSQVQGTVRQQDKETIAEASQLRMTEGYQFRESNRSIGRTVDRMAVPEKAVRVKALAKKSRMMWLVSNRSSPRSRRAMKKRKEAAKLKKKTNQ
ncbi:uncharacterized protein KY384_005192 [Bacidia gigantensis]|uniref:uncharacterized protein n=1 Tax=Bacidia gigantensis TaxID=2732470 RepID=UPI001D0558FB|nr:uncharacterized protein KY384_005192 [Bacidia gigantensis]KAG8529711.1 hypothetical protein KY384_005192 [Bacidia gigantensis]